MVLARTFGNIEWYLVDTQSYEGWNKEVECYEYTIHRDISGLWILRGQGKDSTSMYRNDLMEKASIKK